MNGEVFFFSSLSNFVLPKVMEGIYTRSGARLMGNDEVLFAHRLRLFLSPVFSPPIL